MTHPSKQFFEKSARGCAMSISWRDKERDKKDSDLAWATGANSNTKPRLGSECIRAAGCQSSDPATLTQRFLESVPGDKEMTFDLSVILQMVTWAYPGREEGYPPFKGTRFPCGEVSQCELVSGS